MRTIHREIAAGLVIAKDGKLLFGMKDPRGGGVYADCWHTPGGGIEMGETKEVALAREMHEEMGLDISRAHITLLDDKGTGTSEKTLKDTSEIVKVAMTFYVYKIEFDEVSSDIKVIPGDDIEKFTWVDPKQLREYKLTPPSIALFSRLGWI